MKKIYSLIVVVLLLIPAASQAQYTYQKKDAKQIIEDYIEEGGITEIDRQMKEVWVSPVLWRVALDAQDKERFICLVADYMKYFNTSGWSPSDGKPSVTIYDGQSGKEIAGYSVWSGAYIE